MFQNTSMPGMDMAFPDTCWTPGVLSGAPGPIPYANMATHAAGIPTQVKVLVMCMPVHNVSVVEPLSSGDEAGCSPGGVVSCIPLGMSANTKCSVKVFEVALPATRMLDTDSQNLINAPTGMSAIPGQFKVLALS